ncbi:hypothetical protein [Chryseobacterium oranimense]|uniref:hypothetical protein n=1 Tax=Chryseobacterium oranimense TaxID=421058 RepID=UPI002235F8ED|nr:hypothetical protein [Chryseobacterium oranimense]
MCRYAMVAYKPHYACFSCQKTFKRYLLKDVDRNADISVDAKCPQCGELMANMGLDFKSPAKNDDKQWQHIKSLYRVGITFHSCGCSGPGYIPEDKETLISYLEKIRFDYQESLRFWRNRTEPENKIEREKDYQRNWQKLSAVSNKAKKEGVSNLEGIDYWIKRIYEIEERLRIAAQ